MRCEDFACIIERKKFLFFHNEKLHIIHFERVQLFVIMSLDLITLNAEIRAI